MAGARVLRVAATALAMAILAASPGCAGRPSTDAVATAADGGLALVPALGEYLDASEGYPATGADVFEVWVCDVPLGTSDPTYHPTDARVALDPTALAAILDEHVPAYFAELSGGAYRPRFVPGRIHSMTVDEAPSDCLQSAIAGASSSASGVLAVATAEHAAGQHGGFARAGAGCSTRLRDCSASTTGRGVYVGASDFHPDWKGRPPLDLIEHEIGHLLGWPHSGHESDGEYDSALDVMSNSAAPREADSTLRDGQDTLAINKVDAGWLTPDRVGVVDPDAGPVTVELAAGAATGAPALLVLPVDRDRFLTVERVEAERLDRFLPSGGVTVTLVSSDSSGCAGSTDPACELDARWNRTLSGEAPLGLLTTAEPSWAGFGWEVRLDARELAIVQVSPRG